MGHAAVGLRVVVGFVGVLECIPDAQGGRFYGFLITCIGIYTMSFSL